MKRNARVILGAALAALFATQVASAGEADVKKNIQAWLGANAPKVENVRKLEGTGLYEVQIEGDLVYTDEKISYIFVGGDVVDGKTRKSLTEERKQKLSQIKFSDLPLDLAVKQVKGNGKRVIATFEDPNCGFCKKLAKEFEGMTDITIYTFLVPVFSGAAANEKNQAIWCAPDRVKAWNDYMLKGTLPTPAKCDTSALVKVAELAAKLNIRGTPTMFFADGSRAPGYMPAANLEKALDKGSANR